MKEAALELQALAQQEDVLPVVQAMTHQGPRVAVPPPNGIAGADAEAYVEKGLNDLAPHALFIFNRDLFDDNAPAAQREAARQILDRAGHVKKERQGTSQAPVVVIIGNQQGTIDIPWQKTVEALPKKDS